MLERIEIKNFQKHKHLIIDFDPKVTTIVGTNDVGKSAAYRAIKWIVSNKPNGDAFIRHGSKGSRVSLILDGQKITRRKGTTNSYRINKEKPMKAFRSGVPEDVSAILRLSDLNFQGQHDTPFWFSASPGEVSRQLNRIINMSIIDKSIAYIQSLLRNNTAKKAVIESRLKEAKEERRNTRKAVQLSKDLSFVEELEEEARRAENRYTDLQKLCSGLSQHEDIVIQHKQAIIEGLALQDTLQKAVEQSKKVSALRSLISLVKINKRKAKKPIPNIKPIQALFDAAEEAEQNQLQLSLLVKDVHGTKLQAVRLKDRLIRTKKEFKNSMGKECLLCGTRLKGTR